MGQLLGMLFAFILIGLVVTIEIWVPFFIGILVLAIGIVGFFFMRERRSVAESRHRSVTTLPRSAPVLTPTMPRVTAYPVGSEAEARLFQKKAEAERQTRIQELIVELEALKEYRPELATLAHLEKHAARNKDSLLNRREQITRENLAFRADILPLLEEDREDLIPFGEWERKALAIAERLDVEEKPKPTFEEARAKAMDYLEAKNDDLIGDTVVIAGGLEKASTALDHLNLPQQVKETLLNDLADRMVHKEYTSGNNPKKMV